MLFLGQYLRERLYHIFYLSNRAFDKLHGEGVVNVVEVHFVLVVFEGVEPVAQEKSNYEYTEETHFLLLFLLCS